MWIDPNTLSELEIVFFAVSALVWIFFVRKLFEYDQHVRQLEQTLREKNKKISDQHDIIVENKMVNK